MKKQEMTVAEEAGAETYRMWGWCTNCEGCVELIIPRGVSWKKWVRKRRCGDCGCKGTMMALPED